MTDSDVEPDWDMPLQVNLTPADLSGTLFSTADEVHTAWQTCVDPRLVLAESIGQSPHNANYCRLVEQEYDEEGSDLPWHDWTVEIRIGEICITGHWRLQTNARGVDWDWCNREAQQAFRAGCVLFGQRVGNTIYVEQVTPAGPAPTRH